MNKVKLITENMDMLFAHYETYDIYPVIEVRQDGVLVCWEEDGETRKQRLTIDNAAKIIEQELHHA